jgi:hypothetical protein
MHTRPSQAGLSALVVAVSLAVSAAAPAATSADSPRSATPPPPPGAGFSADVTNEWFLLRPATRYVYTGLKDGQPSRDVVVVTHETKVIEGVPCVSVHDVLYLRGHVGERTTDWYSQDRQGNVWYFGEQTAEFNRHGAVTSTAGTWRAGVDGAKPGIYMPADPRVGQSGRQEYYKGQAEDHFRVIARFRMAFSPRTSSAVLTEEWTPLEPGVLDHKMYARGVGTVLEQTERGGDERNELVSMTIGR